MVADLGPRGPGGFYPTRVSPWATPHGATSDVCTGNLFYLHHNVFRGGKTLAP